MAYKSIDIADKFVRLAIKNEKPLTQISILKLMYFANAIHIVRNNKEPLLEEKFYSWKYGPVLVDLYRNHLGRYSDRNIENYLRETEADLGDKVDALLNGLYNAMGDIAPFKLVEKTHIVGGAWYHTREFEVIKDEDIYEEFSKYLLDDEN